MSGEARATMTLVLGLGDSGLAMSQWLAREGAALRVADSRSAPPHAAALMRTVPSARTAFGPFAESLLEGVGRVALSPGLSREEPVVRAALARGLPVVGETELFAQALIAGGARGRSRVIAITGTNGKTTVTSLVGAMCRATGARTAVAGNIGPAALSALMTCLDAGAMPELWVLELSSFQLETLASLNPEAAAVLNVTDDHLDRYAGLDDYAAAKSRIFLGGGAQVLNREDARVAAMRLDGRRVLTFGLDAPAGEDDFGLARGAGETWLACGARALIAAREVPLAGLHNLANALAALALCRALDLPEAPALEALRRFKGLPHRVEHIAEIGGVAFFDDSKGTNVSATVAALSGLGRKVVLIAGGDGKGQDFGPLGPAAAAHARAVILIGRDAPIIERALAASGVAAERAADMGAAVEAAFAAARPGEAVLLSPACASFDMFRDYLHRAEAFAAAVRSVAKRQAERRA